MTCTDELKIKRGCDGNGTIKWQSEKNIYCARCPERFVLEEADKYMIWKRYKQFGLPFSGGWAEQPAVLLDIIEVCENEYQILMEQK